MKIKIHRLETQPIIGVYDHERESRQPVFFDIEFELTNIPKKDELSETVDYDALSNDVMSWVNESSYQLLESLIADLKRYMLDNYSIKEVSLTCYKPKALEGRADTISVSF